MKTLEVRRLTLRDVGRFEKFDITFSDGLNIICGTNGVGKTTILDAVAASFILNTYVGLRGRASAQSPGEIFVEISNEGQTEARSGRVGKFEIEAETFPFGFQKLSRFLIHIKASRDFSYQRFTSIGGDLERPDNSTQTQASQGISPNEIKQWFANRWLFQGHSGSWPLHQVENLELAVSAFSLLDSRVKLSHVDTSTFDVFVETPDGTLPFEMLSSGFRASYAIVLGLIKEIEFRKLGVARCFDGVILIDEIDLHLHPSWQQRIAPALSGVFPAAQIIATTHSPHVIQSTRTGEVIALVDGPEGPRINQLQLNAYGFQGWTIEEILRDVMGLDDVVTSEYRDAVRNFDDAIDREEAAAVKEALDVLQDMLHPSNQLRKILRLQAAPFLGGDR
ncbi:hypothetical protein ASE23_01935 [Rhizobium sp. Root73]|uniref:AAA family ATPase n=1 Tax=unclassified Rhizobium TaxID=2613769 RepID=UPI0007284A7C|nr:MULTISPECIES: AAA family ATPase [unclassified Rhizobium]KQY17442.1 hypothetical protein ASD36_01935 [Rhizobium sp. Root1334]KRC13323.1 hypothetical protein ASE23_01935 [Rhizobium sp. Root73]